MQFYNSYFIILNYSSEHLNTYTSISKIDHITTHNNIK